LVQGSAASPAAMSWLMQPVIDALGGDAKMFGDDCFAARSSEALARAVMHALPDALARHPVAKIQPKHVRVLRSDEKVFVLGYQLQRRGRRVVVRPPDEQLNLVQCKWYDGFVGDMVAARAQPEDADQVMREFVAGYPAWPGGQKFREAFTRRARRCLLAASNDGE
jgi:hypothetical protein